METQQNSIEALLEKVEEYGKTSIALYKLKAVEKVSNTLSILFVYSVFAIVFSLIIVALNIGLALWLGDILGKVYYGFFCLAGFYLIVGSVLVFLMKDYIKTKIGNSIIMKMLN